MEAVGCSLAENRISFHNKEIHRTVVDTAHTVVVLSIIVSHIVEI